MGGKSPFTLVPSSIAFVDQFSFTAKCSDISGLWFTDQDFAVLLSSTLEQIFGFGVTLNRQRGLNFYESSFVLGDRWGHVCVGGQNDTFLVQLTGQGSLASKPGWEKRAHDWLSTIPSARITRIDIAHDDYTGRYSPQQALQDYIDGKFTSRGRRPHWDQRGNWVYPDGSGLTGYVGKRENGKLLRVYEKGKQLGAQLLDLYAKWTRIELELHNEGRVIPLDTLINPGPYLSGAYPALAWISEESCRIATKQKILEITFKDSVEMVKNQVGRYVNAMLQVYGSAEEVITKITRSGIPERLVMPDWTESPPSYAPSPPISSEHAFDLAFSY
jgi:phage replication initiation protein